MMLERDMSDMVNVMLEQALGYFVAMRSLQESFNEQLSEASHRYQTMVALDSEDAVTMSPQLPEVSWVELKIYYDSQLMENVSVRHTFSDHDRPGKLGQCIGKFS